LYLGGIAFLFCDRHVVCVWYLYRLGGGRNGWAHPEFPSKIFLDTLYMVYAEMTYVVLAYPMGYYGLWN